MVGLFPPPRMKSPVDFFELLVSNMGINLRGGD